MKKNITIFLAAAIIVVSGLYAASVQRGQYGGTPPTVPGATPDFAAVKNGTYAIEGEAVTLADGASADGAVQYFGNEATGDLNGDGKDDVAFVLTRSSGGSGTFFYAAVALRAETGYEGTNAVLLGDRIAPQSTSVMDGIATFNYADRKPGQPMTASPSLGVSKRLRVVGTRLVEGGVNLLADHAWTWVSTTAADGTVTEPRKKDAFSVSLAEDGSVSGTTDCNSFFGRFVTGEGDKISFPEPFGMTKKYCAGSQEMEFMGQLRAMETFVIGDDGVLTMRGGGTTMRLQ